MQKPARVLVLCAQGEQAEVELTASIANALQAVGGGAVSVSVANLRTCDAEAARALAPAAAIVESFEDYRRRRQIRDLDAEVERLDREYKAVNWWLVVAGERSFIDASFLIGGLGQRTESRAYIESLLVSMVRYFEDVVRAGQFDAAMCPEADSLFTYVFYQVARQCGVPVFGISPNSGIREDGRHALYFNNDEFFHSQRMQSVYRELLKRPLTSAEIERVARFKKSVTEFDVARGYAATSGKSYVVPAYSPQLGRVLAYLRKNAARDKNVEYYKIDVVAKAKANVLRMWRRWRSRGLMGTPAIDTVPERSVFFGMQYQPEQTTLVGGNFFANQIATIENVAKCLPLGYTLIVKEHPRGRGARPAWQYRHLTHYPNIRFCDADSKAILRRCAAAVTISSTIGMESIALDKPVVVLGQTYYDFADVVYRPASWPELARTLRDILIERTYEKMEGRSELIDRFFLAYLSARFEGNVNPQSADAIARAVCDELGVARGGRTDHQKQSVA